MHSQKLINFKMNMNDILFRGIGRTTRMQLYWWTICPQILILDQSWNVLFCILLMMMLSVHLSVHQYLFNTNFRGCSCWVVPLSFMSIESQFLTTYCIDRSLATKIHARTVKLWFSLKPRKLIPTNVNKTIVFYKRKISMLKLCFIPFLLYQVQWLQHYHNEPSKLRIDFNRYRMFW